MDTSALEARRLLTSRRDALQRGASSAGMFDVQAALDACAAREIEEIDAALARIDSGDYGSCERCGGAIGRHRLRALPEIRYCAGCTP